MLHPKQILLVDDDPELLAALTEVLQDCGFTVAAVRNGQEVAGAVERLQPNLLLLDEELPGMSGSEVLRTLAGILPPVILMSGVDPGSGLPPAVQSVLRKPFTLHLLLAAIAEIQGPAT